MKTIHVKINNIYNHFIYIDHQWLTWSKRNRPPIHRTICVTLNQTTVRLINNKKAVLPQGNRAMLQVFFSVEVRQQHSLQV